MCNCVSIKMGGYNNQTTLRMPDGQLMGIDKCIADEIQYLWSIGIRTTGCCCGHNITEGYIGVIDKDIEIMKKGGYKIGFNKIDLRDEKNFIPRSYINEKGEINYYEYKDKYKISFS